MLVRKPSITASPLDTPYLDVNYKTFNSTTKATYPIISVAEAWDAISTNKGIISSAIPTGAALLGAPTTVNIEKVLIDTIELAYYEPNEWVEYLQPIYVFSGKYITRGSEGGSVSIYYPAIKGEYINKNTQE